MTEYLVLSLMMTTCSNYSLHMLYPLKIAKAQGLNVVIHMYTHVQYYSCTQVCIGTGTALARISELVVPKYGVNWMSNSFSSHCKIHQKNWILGCPKSEIGCPKDTWTPLWLKAWVLVQYMYTCTCRPLEFCMYCTRLKKHLKEKSGPRIS